MDSVTKLFFLLIIWKIYVQGASLPSSSFSDVLREQRSSDTVSATLRAIIDQLMQISFPPTTESKSEISSESLLERPRVSRKAHDHGFFKPSPMSSSSKVRMGSVQRVKKSEATVGVAPSGLRSQTVLSQPLFIIPEKPGRTKNGRSLKEVEVQGVKIIVGERVPDSPEDKFFTWRNARVIKGELFPNNEADKLRAEEGRRKFGAVKWERSDITENES